jgi:predicted Zn-dependent protease
MKYLLTISLSLFFSSYNFCQKKIIYDFSCMGDDIKNIGTDAEKAFLNFFGSPVKLSEEISLGNVTLKQMKLKYKFIDTGVELNKLKLILNKLTSHIKTPRGFNYTIYLIKNDEINAFTCGGKIFFSLAMYNFCSSDDELACIIGHEISHNELGHINDQISRYKTAQTFGDIGEMSAVAGKIVTEPFNQKNETFCDFKGIDLALASGYDACQNIVLWQRMNRIEGKSKSIDDFFSSHPYSGTRAECSENHLKINYFKDCK